MKLPDPNLSNKDHHAMDSFLGRVFDAYSEGVITKKSAIAGIAHVMSALDIQNTTEAVAWFNQEGIEYFKELNQKI